MKHDEKSIRYSGERIGAYCAESALFDSGCLDKDGQQGAGVLSTGACGMA